MAGRNRTERGIKVSLSSAANQVTGPLGIEVKRKGKYKDPADEATGAELAPVDSVEPLTETSRFLRWQWLRACAYVDGNRIDAAIVEYGV